MSTACCLWLCQLPMLLFLLLAVILQSLCIYVNKLKDLSASWMHHNAVPFLRFCLWCYGTKICEMIRPLEAKRRWRIKWSESLKGQIALPSIQSWNNFEVMFLFCSKHRLYGFFYINRNITLPESPSISYLATHQVILSWISCQGLMLTVGYSESCVLSSCCLPASTLSLTA